MPRLGTITVALLLSLTTIACQKELAGPCKSAADQSCTHFAEGTDEYALCYEGFAEFTDAQCETTLQNIEKLKALPPLSKAPSTATTTP